MLLITKQYVFDLKKILITWRKNTIEIESALSLPLQVHSWEFGDEKPFNFIYISTFHRDSAPTLWTALTLPNTSVPVLAGIRFSLLSSAIQILRAPLGHRGQSFLSHMFFLTTGN